VNITSSLGLLEDAMLGTAHIHAADTLHAEVKVIEKLDYRDGYKVEVISGVGGWDAPGKTLYVDSSMLGEITQAEAAETPAVEPVAKPAPLTSPVNGDEYIAILLQRQAAWIARNHPRGTRFPPLLEWFIQDGDEKWVQLPETTPAPPKKRTPRVCRSAASLREERDKVQAKMDRIADSGSDDPASVNLSPFSRSKPAARAGRRRFEKLDHDLERYTKLDARLTHLNHRINTAEAREARSHHQSRDNQ
jgi:hypothetical protein